jgi:hypothetical protein
MRALAALLACGLLCGAPGSVAARLLREATAEGVALTEEVIVPDWGKALTRHHLPSLEVQEANAAAAVAQHHAVELAAEAEAKEEAAEEAEEAAEEAEEAAEEAEEILEAQEAGAALPAEPAAAEAGADSEGAADAEPEAAAAAEEAPAEGDAPQADEEDAAEEEEEDAAAELLGEGAQ